MGRAARINPESAAKAGRSASPAWIVSPYSRASASGIGASSRWRVVGRLAGGEVQNRLKGTLCGNETRAALGQNIRHIGGGDGTGGHVTLGVRI